MLAFEMLISERSAFNTLTFAVLTFDTLTFDVLTFKMQTFKEPNSRKLISKAQRRVTRTTGPELFSCTEPAKRLASG